LKTYPVCTLDRQTHRQNFKPTEKPRQWHNLFGGGKKHVFGYNYLVDIIYAT